MKTLPSRLFKRCSVQGMEAYVYNTSYSSGGRDRRILSLRPDWVKLVRSYLKNKIQTKGLSHGLRGRVLA
jgi:hypothetical protein